MDIRDLLLAVASTYDVNATSEKGVPGQDLLRSVKGTDVEGLPVGYLAEGHGGNGGPTATPWIGVMDPEITREPKRGLYIAYIFAADLNTVTLTLQQGITSLEKQLGRGQKRREYLGKRAQLLLKGLPVELMKGWHARPDFKSKVERARSYEAGSVAARCYDVVSLPSENSLREDLWSMAEILQRAAAVEMTLSDEWTPSGGSRAIRRTAEPVDDPQGLDGFRPKNGSDYVAHIRERTVKKSRNHEVLIGEFGTYIANHGFVPVTERMHPKDLVLLRGEAKWLVEAKTVKLGNPTKAVREAVGQLLEYSHFLFERVGQPAPHLLGLFTEDIGAYAPYLEKHGVGSIWKTVDGWGGSDKAFEWGMIF